MLLKCPHCHFSKEVDTGALPALPLKVNCPKCGQNFTFGQSLSTTEAGTEPAPSTLTPPPPPVREPVTAAADADPRILAEKQDVIIPPPPIGTNAGAEEPPAGFWVRAVAALLDSLLSSILQFVMMYALEMVIRFSGLTMRTELHILSSLFGILVALFYYVFFTGYNGQTPGKMALGIQVVDESGSAVGYGQAFVRETVGKFLSSLILGIGYLMVALRQDKRALHDLIARTRVIRIK
ncbi:MAG: zinc-ribbon domain-containing protein [Desulfuromonadaceae bacterium]|nr:zinc-ribbon domain-containing protein [Desulfuromonadaceae bacterium]